MLRFETHMKMDDTFSQKVLLMKAMEQGPVVKSSVFTGEQKCTIKFSCRRLSFTLWKNRPC